MPYLFESWQEILERIRQARQILLFLDYDGTLTPIAEKPESAVLSTHVRGILKRVSQHEKFKLAIISGRSLEDIKALVGLDGITYAGNHGLEIEYLSNDPQNKRQITIRYIHPLAARYRPTIREAGEVLLQGLANIQGVLIEDKGLTLSVHYRLVKPTEVEIVKKLFFQALAPYLNVASISVQPCSCSSRESDKEKKPKTSAPLKVTQGKKVLEVRPLVAWDKGKAIEWLLQVYDHKDSLPIFAGDDITDEDAFKFLRRLGGISVLVGKGRRRTAAAYYLNSPQDLHSWLEALLLVTRSLFGASVL